MFEAPFYMVYNNLRLLVRFGNLWSKFDGQTSQDVKVAQKLSMLSLTTLTTFCYIQATLWMGLSEIVSVGLGMSRSL